MATREEIALALQRFVAEARVLSEDGQVMVWADGTPVVLSLLDALRALDELGVGGAEVAGPCTHPLDARRAAGVMGSPDQFFCLSCGQLVVPEAGNGAARDNRE